MRKLGISILALLVLMSLMPLPVDHQDGAYNLTSRLAWCRTRPACLHEIGHALDQQAGWVSQSTEFYKALQMFLYAEIYQKGVTELPAGILEITYRGTGASGPIKRELYAYLFQISEGNPERMPESLRGYFDWKAAETYLSRLSNTQTIYWMN
jgi:hypothetical protein